MNWQVSHIKCQRCGHTLARRKYAREVTPHKAQTDGYCNGCRDCYIIWETQGRAQSPRPPEGE